MFKNPKFFILTFFLSFAFQMAEACTVCFGGVDSKLRDGFTWGVLLLGSLPFILLTAFILTIVFASRKHRSQ